MDKVTSAFYDHSSAKRVYTDAVSISAIRAEYPDEHVSIIPAGSADLLQYAAAGFASAVPLEDESTNSSSTTSLKWRRYSKPATRLEGGPGTLKDVIQFGKYKYTWGKNEFIMYYIDGRDNYTAGFVAPVVNQYLIGGDAATADALTIVAGQYSATLHDEIWVFEQGYWQKDHTLFRSIQKATWDNVILDEDMKSSLRDDVQLFFDARSQYEELGVPWKRGIIFHGPPGNGKSISIKATMHMLYDRKEAVPTLYVKTLAAFVPPEYSLRDIFLKARQEAPCYLVFEDLDSVVSDQVRSFFLNEVDGLSTNDGILMVGSTNHLERLDPGISKRPSRFDRKFLFANPDMAQRDKYCHFWQGKLKHNKKIDFPDKLCSEIAKITGGFSFAYIQEAFVAALLVIAGSKGQSKGEECDRGEEWELVGRGTVEGTYGSDLNDYVLWVEIKKQVELLRKDLDSTKWKSTAATD